LSDSNFTCPMMTSDTSSGCTLALLRASLMTILPISCALRADKDPLYAPETSFGINFLKCYDSWYFAYNSITILTTQAVYILTNTEVHS
jgi:hypothetical protein